MMKCFSVLILAAALASSLESDAVVSINDATRVGTSTRLTADGEYLEAVPITVKEELGEAVRTGNPALWTHVELPVQLKWGSDSECLTFRTGSALKVDAFYCQDDTAGEAVFTFTEGKIRLWGDPTKCLSTDTTVEPKLVLCSSMSSGDTWEAPEVRGGYGAIKSVSRETCLVPVVGGGARAVELAECGDDAVNWAMDNKDGGDAGWCSVRWPDGTTAGTKDFSSQPSIRNCFKSTGTQVGTWHDEVVLQGEVGDGFNQEDGRLLNHRIGEMMLSVDTPKACATRCRDTGACKAFNYHATLHKCELLGEIKGTLEAATDANGVQVVAPMDFDQSEEASGWMYYEPKASTVGTKCTSGCLPKQVMRITYPVASVSFTSSIGLLPDTVAAHFDEVVFAGDSQSECFNQVDGITLEIETSCQSATTTTCVPDVAEPSKQKCTLVKESGCRRMTVMPTTFFSSAKTAWRTSCGHGADEDGKVWHGARIALDVCEPINGFSDYCGNLAPLM